MQLVTKNHVKTETRSRILETSTRLRTRLIFTFGLLGTQGLVVYVNIDLPPESVLVFGGWIGFSIFLFAFVAGVVYHDSNNPRELDIAIIGDTVHLSAALLAIQLPMATKFPLADLKEVRYSALGGLRIRVEGRGKMKLPNMGTSEMREDMAIWRAEMAGVELKR